MGICAILEKKIPGRDCTFNAPVREFLDTMPEENEMLRGALERMLETEQDIWIICDLSITVSRTAVSNRIIYYRDIFKMKEEAMKVPYLIYRHTEERDYALLIVMNEPSSYLYARGYYYCMSEPGGEYYDCRNDIVEIAPETEDDIVSVWESMKKEKSGVIQRRLDRKNFASYDELFREALETADALKAEAEEKLKGVQQRDALIRHYVSRWFLLKKVVYVQYMVNRQILSSVHDGDSRMQRNMAKQNADAVVFISFRNLWEI
jgi:hypothetical protein